MPIVNATQPGLNATFWGINPHFKSLIDLLSKRGVNVEPIQTEAGKSVISIGTPSIVVFRGKKISKTKIIEADVRDLKVSYEPDVNSTKKRMEPKLPDRFFKPSQISNFAASYLRAQGYTVNVSAKNPDHLPELDLGLDSGIRFDLVDPTSIDPEVLKKELGL